MAKAGLEAEWISPQTLATTTHKEVVMDHLSVPVSFPSSLSNWWAWPIVYYLGGLWK